jgi:chitodextrinase
MKKFGLSIALLALLLAACGDDVSPPSTPEGFAVKAVSSSEIQLSWSPSEDNVGVEGYEVYRDNALHASVPTPGMVDSGLANSTTYCYAVRAYDEEGNKSAFTEQACDATFAVDDTLSPTAPTGLIANAVSDTRIRLDWEPSTDDVGVKGYNVYRDGVFANSVSLTVFLDTGLTNSTGYCYIVTAFDRVDNESAESVEVCETTLDP